MNAEFTEQKIVVTIETIEGEDVTTITPAKVRKGLDTNAFVGAMLCAPRASSLIVGAVDNGEKIELMTVAGDGKEKIQYDPATGELAIVPVNSGSPNT